MSKSQKEITPGLLVKDIVADNYQAAEVFRKYHINFLDAATLTLDTVCQQQGLLEADVIEKLRHFSIAYQDAEQWPIDFMVDYLMNIHHNYFTNNIPVVEDYIGVFILSHSHKFPDAQQLPVISQHLFNKIGELVKYERDSLFPYIKRIIYAWKNNEVYGKLFIKTLGKLSVDELNRYHDRINLFVSQLEKLTHNFSTPQNTCSCQSIMLQKLKEFVYYIEQHLSIEKNILVPAILQMEKNLLEKINW